MGAGRSLARESRHRLARAGGIPGFDGEVAPQIAFLEGRHADRRTLARASRLARRWNADPEQVLIRCGWVSQGTYYRALAAHLGLAFSGLQDARLDESALAGTPETSIAAADLVPVIDAGGNKCLALAPRGAGLRALIAMSARPDAGAHLRQRLVITTPAHLADLAIAQRGEELSAHACGNLLKTAPECSAASGLTLAQKLGLAGAALALAAGLALYPLMTLAGLNVVLAGIFACVGASRAGAALAVLEEVRAAAREAASLGERDLPVYTLLVPLFREAAVLPHLVAALQALDYPKAKLDIKLILEAEDLDTRKAAARLALPGCFHIIVVPPSQPQTKPKALNFALAFARGSLVAIYDAEDRPDPGQLRRAAAAFANGGETLACVQGRLGFYNAGRNWLTRQFAIEYCALFDALLPALHALRLPIPLGGTSNHFRRDILEEVGGWDPHNVTEDADLGFRLARRGYHVASLNSQTLEEACERLPQWLGQRTRWLKGWIQTYFVHMRQPLRALHELGPLGFAALNILIGGMVLSALVHPLFVALIGAKLVSGALAADPASLGGWWLAALNVWNLTIGYAAAMLLAWIGLGIAGRRGLRRALVWMPFYWLLISLAAYRALWDYARRPFHWEKTEHGAPRFRLAGAQRLFWRNGRLAE